jgi:acyl dehydratase
MTTKIEGIEGLKEKVGAHLGYSAWREVTQKQVNLFADATDDHQWIHVDIERAKAGPFGGPIAHGYLTLSMAPAFMNEILEVSGIAMGVNYGLNKLRFPSPVPVGSRLRAGAVLSSVEDVAGGVQVALELTFETEGGVKPACVAELLFRYYS